MVWKYNERVKRWEMTADGWRGVVARQLNQRTYKAWIEPVADPSQQLSAQHVFPWIQDAQAWCEVELMQRSARSLWLNEPLMHTEADGISVR